MTLEGLLDVPDIRLLEAAEREPLLSGVRALADIHPSVAEMFLAMLGTEMLKEGKAPLMGKYASLMANALQQGNCTFEAVALPLVYEVTASGIIQTAGESGLGTVAAFADELKKASEVAHLLGQQGDYFVPFLLGSRHDIIAHTEELRHATGQLLSLYSLDERAAKGAAAVAGRLQGGRFDAYVSGLRLAVEKLGSRHKMVKALLNPDKADMIAKKLEMFPQFPLVFAGNSETPVSPSFYHVAGESPKEMRNAAKAQQALLHRNHFDLEMALIEESMPDIVRRIGLSGSGKIGLLDACTGDGAKFAETLISLLSAMARSKVEDAVVSGACLVDYNPYLLIESLGAIESLGIAVDGEATGFLPYRVISKSRFEPGKAGKEIPVLKLTLPQGNILDLVNDEGFHRFRQRFPTYLTTLLGTTVANFDPDTIARTLHDVTSEYCLVSVYLDEGNDAKLRSIYGSELVRELSSNNLRIAGVSREDFGKFDYLVDVQRWRYEGNGYVIDPLVAAVTYFEATEPVEGALFDFGKGERAPGLLSIKPSDEQFRTIMAANGLETAAMYRHEDVALYLLRKAPAATLAGSLPSRGIAAQSHSQLRNLRSATGSPA